VIQRRQPKDVFQRHAVGSYRPDVRRSPCRARSSCENW
jgi:hypothetical protein